MTLVGIALMSAAVGAETDVRAFGATGDGVSDDTPAFEAALGAAEKAGGGTIQVPPGRYRIRPIRLGDGVTLHVESGATILGSERVEDYPPVRSRWEGVDQLTHAPLIEARGVENVALTGGGTIDGRGRVWWERHQRGELVLPRPRLIEFMECRDVRVEGVRLVNSPSWTLHSLYSENVTIRDVTIRNPADSPNTDGIDIDSSRNVRISGCSIDTGDDAIALKSGRGEAGRRAARPTENVTITNCTLLRGHAGLAIGSETAGGIRGVVVSNTIFDGTRWGIRIKSRRGRGGVVEDVLASNLVMRDVARPLIVDLFYGDESDADEPRPVDAGTPRVRGLRIQNLSVRGAERAGKFSGLPEMPVEDVSLTGVRIEAKRGLELRHVLGLTLTNLTLRPSRGVPAIIGPGEDVEVAGLRIRGELGGEPVLELDRVREARVSGLRPADPPSGPPIRIRGAGSAGIRLEARKPLTGSEARFEDGATSAALVPGPP